MKTEHNNSTKNEILDLRNSDLACKFIKNLKKNTDLVKRILDETGFLDKDASLHERVFCIEFSKTGPSICKNENCQNFTKFRNHSYCDFCSLKCVASAKSILEKKKKTSEEKYGKGNWLNRKKAKETFRAHLNDDEWRKEYFERVNGTKLEKYGSKNNHAKSQETQRKKYDGLLFFQTEEFQEKSKNTRLERYGDENFVNSEQCKETWAAKDEDTILAIVAKSKNTKLERYGDENFNNSEQIRKTTLNFSEKKKRKKIEKCKNTVKERFGVDHISKSPKIQKQIQQTTLDKYGCDSVLQLPHVREKRRKLNHDLAFENLQRFSHLVLPLFSREEYIGQSDNYRWKCVQCKTEFVYGFMPRCLKCFPILNGKSKAEDEIETFLKSQNENLEIERNRKKIISPLELDLWIPSKNVAIEFNGIYWHSLGDNRTYHLNKTKECEKKGIHLIHIFEDDYNLRREIVLSRLASILFKNDAKIYARKCEVKEIESKEKGKFLNENHIQGNDKSSVKLGLFYENELVSVMTFGKARFNKNYEWELLRFCSKLGHVVIGGAGKLLKYFEKVYLPKSLISYADRCWSQSCGETVYDKLGFKLNSISSPNYWYVVDRVRQSRIKFQKHKLTEILPNFDPNLTEWQNMEAEGYTRIWDCGNLVFVKTY
jgi:hypothetical protein